MVILKKEQKERLNALMPKIQKGRASDHDAKKEMVMLHNEIFGTRYKPTTSCPKCLQTCYTAIKRLYNEQD